MNAIFYLEINLIGLVILVILLHNHNREVGRTAEQQVFSRTLLAVMAMLVVDSATWWLNGKQFPLARPLGYLASTCYFLLNCFIPFLWLLYTMVYFNVHRMLLKKCGGLIFLPLAANTAMTLSNLKWPLIFYLDGGNNYTRGEFFFLPVLFGAFYLAFSAILAAIQMGRAENELERSRCRAIFLFLAMPVVATILQSLFLGLSLIWISVVLSLLLIFVNVQNSQLSTDALTGLNNRYQFDKLLRRTYSTPDEREKFVLLMIDVNKFKEINDSYGHVVGDRALVGVAEVLRRACAGSGAFLSRYGGDEFTIITQSRRLERLLTAIAASTRQYNEQRREPFTLSLSVGYAHFADPGATSTDALITLADESMYRQKARGPRESTL